MTGLTIFGTPLLIIVRGLPGSGKTTRARQWVAGNPGSRMRLNRDDYRTMLHGRRRGGANHNPAQEHQTTIVQHAGVRAALNAAYQVIVDDTNLHHGTFAALTVLAADTGATVEVWDMRDVPLDQCLAWNLTRLNTPGFVPPEVIEDMHRRYIETRTGG